MIRNGNGRMGFSPCSPQNVQNVRRLGLWASLAQYTPIILLTITICIATASAGQASSALPEGWAREWTTPSVQMRPLQIVHGPAQTMTTAEGIKALKDLGLGGIVCNVNFNRYMTSPEHWDTLTATVQAAADAGFRIWIYDEDGYPSAAAGGLVLRRNKDFEALALTYDPQRDPLFTLRPAYEHTHASNNFYAARRYPNLIDERATDCFIEVTHEAYWKRLQKHFGKTIEAFFTDEPSLMAVNIGPLPDDVRKNVRVADPLDEQVQPLPSVPWVRDLPALYKQRYGQDLEAVRKSLFTGDSPEDRRVRTQFWSLIADLVSDRYFGQLQTWASTHSVASSGHTLWEEMPLHHVPLEGNAIKSLMRMDIPGLDMLNSDPEAVIYSGWLTAVLPGSAAIFNGGRRVMTEVSDFSQTMGGSEPVPLDLMQATAAWQAAFGVTEFTLYYSYHARSAEVYQAYGTYVGRLNAILRDASLTPSTLLYYPIHDLWGEYHPIAEKLTLETQSPHAQHLVQSFLNLGQSLTRNQLPFAVIDHELLAEATVQAKKLKVRNREFSALVLPAEVELPAGAREVVQKFKAAGGCVITSTDTTGRLDAQSLHKTTGDPVLSPASDRIVTGRFQRQNRTILLLVNTGKQPYTGTLTGLGKGPWLTAHPENASTQPADTTDETTSLEPTDTTGNPASLEPTPATDKGQIKITLQPRQSILLITP